MGNEPSHYPRQFDEVIRIITNARNRAMEAVNAELIRMYWNVGEYLSALCFASKFGDKVIDEVAAYIAQEHPDIKGFNRRGLYRMKQFYETYKGDKFVTPLVTQISWTNQLDKSSVDYIRLQDGGGTTFLHGTLCERALFQTGIGAPDRHLIL